MCLISTPAGRQATRFTYPIETENSRSYSITALYKCIVIIIIISANETKRIGGVYEIGRSVCVSVYTITAQAATPAITLTSLPCSKAALPSASPLGRNGGALL